MDFHALLKSAYVATLNHPGLWLLGLFLAGGFNTNYLYVPAVLRQAGLNGLLQHQSFFNEPTLLLAVICLLGAGIILANVAKTIFVLHAASLLEIPRLRARTETSDDSREKKSLAFAFRHAGHYLPRVIAISLFSIFISSLATACLALPLWRLPDLQGQTGFVLLTLGLFLILTVIISCLNIFTTFFIVLYDQSVNTALGAAVDLLKGRWPDIVNFLLVLMILYVLSLFVGSSIIRIGRDLSAAAGHLLFPFSILTGSAIMQAAGSLTIIILWVWMGIVHAFFNAALLALFSKLIAPASHVPARQTS